MLWNPRNDYTGARAPREGLAGGAMRMRPSIAVVLAATAVLIIASFAGAESLPPNELGRVMILEYHKIDYPEERWTRTPENFRRDLETLYARGYRLQSLNDAARRQDHGAAPAPRPSS